MRGLNFTVVPAGSSKSNRWRLYRPEVFAPWQDGLRTLVARVPCMVLWGDRDPYLDRGLAERFGARQVHHFPDAGHWLPVEEPDAVAAHLLAFLAGPC